jgi:hypothetical protein
MTRPFHPYHHISPPFSPDLTTYHTIDYKDLVKRVNTNSQKYYQNFFLHPVLQGDAFTTYYSPFHQNRFIPLSTNKISMVKSLVKRGEMVKSSEAM